MRLDAHYKIRKSICSLERNDDFTMRGKIYINFVKRFPCRRTHSFFLVISQDLQINVNFMKCTKIHIQCKKQNNKKNRFIRIREEANVNLLYNYFLLHQM